MLRRRLVAVGAVGFVMALAAPARTAQIGPESIGPDHPLVSWEGRRFHVATTGEPDACRPGSRHESHCDHATLVVTVDPGYWESHTGGMELAVGWKSARDDFDLYLYDAAGRLVGIAASSGTTREQLFVARPAGTYEARVVPVSVVESDYRASARFESEEGAGGDMAGGGTTTPFTYGPDQANWYWKDQDERRASLPMGRRVAVRVPSPQASDTLPIAIRNGKQYKNAALELDLSSRGVVEGSEITSFTLTFGRQSRWPAAQPREEPTPVPSKQTIAACRIVELWGPGEAELWSLRPTIDPSSCTVGIRTESSWVFDLTDLSRPWAEDPSSALGVLLTGGLDRNDSPESWQINLKLPEKDDPSTAIDEYEQTEGRVTVDVQVAGPEDSSAVGAGSLPPASGGSYLPSSDSSVPSGEDGPYHGAGSPGIAAGSEGVGVFAPEPPLVRAADSAKKQQPVATLPRLPWYAWALMPLALVAMAAAQSTIHRNARTRPDGVISAIRRRNRTIRPPAPGTPYSPAAAWRRFLPARWSRAGTTPGPRVGA